MTGRIVVWSSQTQSPFGYVTLAFSDGTAAINVDMESQGQKCAEISFPARSVSWVRVIPWGTGNAGFKEIEVWATSGTQYSNNNCVVKRNVTPAPASFSRPNTLATPLPLPTPIPGQNLVVSTNPSESTDGQTHDSSNPYVIPLGSSYGNVTIKQGAFASALPWNGTSGGVVSFTATGTVEIDGTLTVNGLGYHGGPSVPGADIGRQGESYPGIGINSPGANGGGGGAGGVGGDGAGGGGGYGSPGQNAQNRSFLPPVYGGNTYGDSAISTLYPGSGGGSSSAVSGNFGAAGGAGGGAVQIVANSITVTGTISANGANGASPGTPGSPFGGGGGSGGCIRLHANTVNAGTNLLTVAGGAGGYGFVNGDPNSPASGGNGGAGRIRIDYSQSFSGSVSPPASVALFQLTPVQDLVVSTVASESTDQQVHDASNPYFIPLDAQYHSVTIKPGAYASTSTWNGVTGGIVRFIATGLVQIDGVVTVDGKGYRGGRQVMGAASGIQGESNIGISGSSSYANVGGGGGGTNTDSGGGGGGYGSAGQPSQNAPDITPANGGSTYGDPTLTTLYLGSGGGSAGADSANIAGAGGPGGGVISIRADSIIVTGQISANGAAGLSAGASADPHGGGGGSGGSIRLVANTIDVGTNLVTALGGPGGYGYRTELKQPAMGGTGGVGRIQIEHSQPFSGSTNPPAVDTPFQPSPTVTPTIAATATPGLGLTVDLVDAQNGVGGVFYQNGAIDLVIGLTNGTSAPLNASVSWDTFNNTGTKVDALSFDNDAITFNPESILVTWRLTIPATLAPGTYTFVGSAKSAVGSESRSTTYTVAAAPTPTVTVTTTASPTATATPSTTATLTASATPTLTPSLTPTEKVTVVTPLGGVQLLPQSWSLRGNNGAAELYQSIDPNVLRGKDTIQVTYNLHGLTALGGDASAFIFDQSGWRYVSLSNYGTNGRNGPQVVSIPLANFPGLNLSAPVGLLHTRFWYGGPFTVDITSVVVYAANTPTSTSTALTRTRTPSPTLTPTLTR